MQIRSFRHSRSSQLDNPQKVRDNILNVLLDYLAVGIDPQKTTIFIQSLIPQIAELYVIYMNFTFFINFVNYNY